MSFCINCGTQLADGNKFCINCGAQQPEPVQAPAQPVVEQPVVEQVPVVDPFAAQPVMEQPVVEQAPVVDPFAAQPVVEQPVVEQAPVVDPFAAQPVMEQPAVAPAPVYNPQPKKKKNLGLILGLSIGGGVALITIVAIVIALILTRKTEIDLSKYVKIEVEGYEGSGRIVDYTLDKQKLLKDIMKDKGVKNVDDLKRSDVPDEIYNTINNMYMSIEDLSGSGTYKNGDKIDVEVYYPEYGLDEAKLKFKNASFEYEVKGLDPLTEYDIFQGVEVTFSGMSGSGYFSYNVTSNDDIYDNVYFDYDYRSDLKNGDTITLEVRTYSGDQTGSYYGYKFKSVTKEYTVEGLEKYIEDKAELSKDVLDVLKGLAVTEIDDEYGNNYYATMSNLTYIGSYFAKDDDYAYGNYVITVHKATLTSKDGDFEPFDIFLPVQHKYLMLDGDGALQSDDISSYLKGGFYVDGTWIYFDGYNDPYTMYEDLVASYNYSYEFSETSDMPDFSQRPTVEGPTLGDGSQTGDGVDEAGDDSAETNDEADAA